MRGIPSQCQGLIEKDLFTLPIRDAVFIPVFSDVAVVPVEAITRDDEAQRHHPQCISRRYTPVKTRRGIASQEFTEGRTFLGRNARDEVRSLAHRATQQLIHLGDPALQLGLSERRHGAVDVELVVDADPAPAAAVLRRHGDGHGIRQAPGADGEDVQGLVFAEAVADAEVLAVHDRERREGVEQLQVAHAPRLHYLGPVRDRHGVGRGVRRIGVRSVRTGVKVGWKQIEALGLYAERRVGDATLADEEDLLPAAEGFDDRRPFLQRGVVRQLHALARNVTELTGPSHTVTAVTTAFSVATADDSSRWNHSAMFSAEGLTSVNGGTSLMQP